MTPTSKICRTLLFLMAILGTVLHAQTPAGTNGAGAPHIHVMPTSGFAAPGVPTGHVEGPLVMGPDGIGYNGGPVMPNTVNVYIVWYGTWSGDTSTTIIPNFLNSLGGSPYFDINATYYDSVNETASSTLRLAGTTTNAYSEGTNLSDAAIQAVVSSAISSGQLPSDANGIYFVLTSADVTVTANGGQSCVQICGYHGHVSLLGFDAKYAWVGNPAECPTQCIGAQNRNSSPNNNIGADAMTSIMAHEIDESITDPDLNAWNNGLSQEVGDLCNFAFGSTYQVSNGSYANMALGGQNYLIQGEWVNAGGGYCGYSYSLGAPIPASPASVTVGDHAACPTADVMWPAVSGASSYELWRSASGSFTSPYLVYAGTGTASIQTVSARTFAYFRAQACSSGGCSALTAQTAWVQGYTRCP